MLLAYARAARCAATAIGLLGMLMTARSSPAAFNVVLAGGDATPASIQATVDAFRAFLGDPNNANNPGPLASGRREINWDGGGATTATVTTGALTTFQNTRGATFTTPGPGSCKRRWMRPSWPQSTRTTRPRSGSSPRSESSRPRKATSPTLHSRSPAAAA